jgi:Ca2+-binding EF-hand superfamily protein
MPPVLGLVCFLMSLQLSNLFRFIFPATLFLAAGLRADEIAPPAALTPTEAALLRRFDTNGDGKIDETELADAHEAMRSQPAAQPAARQAAARQVYARLLARFDTQRTGHLDPPEQAAAVQFLRQNAPRVYQALLQRFDLNGDGELDAGETAAMFGAIGRVATAPAPRPPA